MNLYQNEGIPGLKELAGIGSPYNYFKNDMQRAYDMAVRPTTIGQDCSVIMASVTTNQMPAIKLLKDNGFSQVGRGRKNPNSGNTILLFAKFVGKQRKVKRQVNSASLVSSRDTQSRTTSSHVSCGINALVINPTEKLTKKGLNKLLLNGDGVCAMVFTNIEVAHEKITKLLEKNKFKNVGQATASNGKEYAYLVRRLNKKEIALAKRNWKTRDWNDW